MKLRPIALACSAGAALVALAGSVDAEPASSADMTNVIGTMNSKTGAFTPLPRATTGDATTEGGTFSGWVVVNITASNKSQIPTTANVGCAVSWSSLDTQAFTALSRVYSTRARVTATSITCTVKVPYTLYATNQNTTTITIQPTLSVYDVTSSPGSSKPTTAIVQVPGASFTLPASGVTTTKSFTTFM